MKKTNHIILLILLTVLSINNQAAYLTTKADLVFEGTILQIGPSPNRDSGSVDVYQLVKYRINHIYTGVYEDKEIVVDHLILRSDDLKHLKVGDNVCVAVYRSKTISLRYNDEELRKASDIIKTFYIGRFTKRTSGRTCKDGIR